RFHAGGEDSGLDEAGADRVDADIGAAELRRAHRRQMDDAGLGHRIGDRTQASPVISSMVLGLPPAPALLKRMSRPPKASFAACIVALMSSSRMTSQWWNFTWPLKRRSSSRPSWMSAARTRAPSATNSSTVPRPMPDAAPVMTATLSFSRSTLSSRLLTDYQSEGRSPNRFFENAAPTFSSLAVAGEGDREAVEGASSAERRS